MQEPIILTKSQLIASLKNCYDLLVHGKVLNTSNVGKGKSIMLSWTLKKMGVRNSLMFCTSSLVPSWENYKEKYDLPFLDIMSYESLRGIQLTRNEVELKHGLLIRRSDGSFTVTDYFKELVEDGLVICCDESQKFKTTCDIQKAVKAMCSYIHQRRHMSPTPEYLSGYYFNSTTPFDREKHLINFCYTSGVITHPELMSKDGNTMLGLGELYDYCLELDRVKTENIIGTEAQTYRNAENIAYKLCNEVFISTISSFTGKVYDVESVIEFLSENYDFDFDSILFNEDDEDLERGARQTIYNTYCKITNVGLQLLKLGNYMISPASMNSVQITAEMDETYAMIIDKEESPLRERMGITHGQITKHTVETYYNIVPMAKKFLETVQNSKIVIFLDYKESISVAARMLEEYGVMVITGDVDKSDRELMRLKFQEPNLDYRVKITMNQLSSVGVEYDDKDGNFPRAGFGIEGYNISNPVQCPGRLCRKNSASHSLFFYIKIDDDNNIDESVDRNIEEKSRIFRETLKNNGVIPPDCFVDLYYNSSTDFNSLLQNAGNPKYKSKTRELVSKSSIVIRRSTLGKDII